MGDKILIIEDDAKTAALISLYIEREGYEPISATDGQQGLALAKRHQPIVVILDLMLPKLDGWEVCRQLRQRSQVPIIMLTARGDEIDRVSGLTLGADDYVVKPFSPRELVARVKAVLRRTLRQDEPAREQLQYGEIILDTVKRRVYVQGKPVALTPHEYGLLKAFMSYPGKVYTRGELLDRLYPRGEAMVIDRVVDVHVGKLRQKIEDDATRPGYIVTVRGLGYRFGD